MSATALPDGALVIGDERIASSDLGRIEHTNPATGEVQASFVAAGPAEVDRAVRGRPRGVRGLADLARRRPPRRRCCAWLR